MIEISREMTETLSALNCALRKKKNGHPERNVLRNFITDEIGIIKKISPLSPEKLGEIEEKGGMAAVDGSVNRTGGASPHYIDLFRGVAKSTLGNTVTTANFYSPMLDSEYSEDEHKRDKLLADIELKVAILALEELKPKILMMDGSLLRYRIYDEPLWEELKDKALCTDTILLGVIKDIKTSFIGDGLKIPSYDRELLYGLLETGEFLEIKSEVNSTKKSGFASGFLRAGLDPNVCGIDVIYEQTSALETAARLSYALTPKNSRGVPLFLDIVDKEAKITDAMLKALLENYIDRELYEMFIMSERQKRN